MPRPLVALAAPIAVAAAAPAAAQAPALSCDSTDERTAYFVSGEVAGSRAWVTELPTGWVFGLMPAPFGYDLGVFSGNIGADGTVDFSAITPPFNGPNPRQLYGWHFRNADNTGPNRGEVNAPQELRLFIFSPALAGTGGFRPPDGNFTQEPNPDDGRGWLRIDDYGLADLDPGETARLVYLNFSACLTWPRTFDPPPPEPIGFEPEDIERIRACGLDPALEPVPYLQPPLLELDLDFDGAWDFVMPVERVADGKRAIAICRAGTWLDVIGLEGDMGELTPAYFENIDWWNANPAGPIGQGGGGEPPPVAAGDTITIGKEDSSSVLIYWDGEAFRSYWQGD